MPIWSYASDRLDRITAFIVGHLDFCALRSLRSLRVSLAKLEEQGCTWRKEGRNAGNSRSIKACRVDGVRLFHVETRWQNMHEDYVRRHASRRLISTLCLLRYVRDPRSSTRSDPRDAKGSMNPESTSSPFHVCEKLTNSPKGKKRLHSWWRGERKGEERLWQKQSHRRRETAVRSSVTNVVRSVRRNLGELLARAVTSASLLEAIGINFHLNANNASSFLDCRTNASRST